jgi:hypothetical protein
MLLTIVVRPLMLPVFLQILLAGLPVIFPFLRLLRLLLLPLLLCLLRLLLL